MKNEFVNICMKYNNENNNKDIDNDGDNYIRRKKINDVNLLNKLKLFQKEYISYIKGPLAIQQEVLKLMQFLMIHYNVFLIIQEYN